MGGGFLREYEIGQEDYGGVGNGEYDYGDDYGYDEYGEGEYGAEYGDDAVYGDDYGGQGGETKLPEKDDYDYIREKKRRRRRRRRQASTNEEDYDYSVSKKGGALQTNKTWLFNGNTWEEKTPMSIPRDRPACSIINMPDGEVSVPALADIITLVLNGVNPISIE